MYILVRKETHEEICPSPLFALSAAFGILPQIELIATLIIGGFLILTGIAKPVEAHKKSGLMTLLKGAGMAEFEEKLVKLEQKRLDDYNKEMASGGAAMAVAAQPQMPMQQAASEPWKGPCGKMNDAGTKFCTGCGTPYAPPVTQAV